MMKFLDFVKRFDNIFIWAFVNIAFGLMWVGAEYIFEGAVHSSYVDAAVNGFVSFFITRELIK